MGQRRSIRSRTQSSTDRFPSFLIGQPHLVLQRLGERIHEIGQFRRPKLTVLRINLILLMPNEGDEQKVRATHAAASDTMRFTRLGQHFADLLDFVSLPLDPAEPSPLRPSRTGTGRGPRLRMPIT